MRHGHLTVVREKKQRWCGSKVFECHCDCGKTVAVRSDHFYPSRQHCSQQCGFLSDKRSPDLTGKRFTRWVVVARYGNARQSFWNCKCECGTEKVVSGNSLSVGASQSCGCLLGDLKRAGRTDEQLEEAHRAACRACNRKNPARIKANKIKYENKLSKATPNWLTDEQWAAMNAVYQEAKHLTQKTGIRHEVDHIVPVNGKTVSGLHVPWNLQILTQAENVSKSNRYADLLGD